MIKSLSIWAEQIVVAVIIATLIEMILPNGNNKKYIKAVIGVYILFTIISPIFGNMKNFNFDNFDYETYFKNTQSYQTMSDSLISHNNQSTEEIYLNNLKQDMKQKLKEKGYLIEKIAIQLELNKEEQYGRIYGIDLIVSKIKEEKNENEGATNIIINTINIGNKLIDKQDKNKQTNEKTSNISSSEERQIKEYLSGVYEVNKKNIRINENT